MTPPSRSNPSPPASAFTEDGSPHGDVWRLAWPSVLTFSLMTTNSILDRAFVGQLGSSALAAVGIGGQLTFLMVSLSMAITVGTTALVSRFIGARDADSATMATGQSIGLALIIGLVCTAGVWIGMDVFFAMLNIGPPASTLCRAFLGWALLGMVPSNFAMVLASALRGMGDTRTPLKISLCANVVHIIGDWTLMLGHWGAPRMGIAGGGAALSASMVVSCVLYVAAFRRTPLRGALGWRAMNPSAAWAWRILRIGIPAAITAMLRSTSLMGFTGVLTRTPQGISAVAALPIGLTAESIAFMPGFGFSVAASTLVGQSLGAKRPDRAARYGWAATWQGVTIMSIMGLVFFVMARPFARVFTHDPAVLPLAVDYMRVMALSEPFLAFGMILTGALQGAGDTMRPTVLTAITFWLIRLPLAWLLAIHMGFGAHGAWLAMALTTVIGGLLTVQLFRDGRWQRTKV